MDADSPKHLWDALKAAQHIQQFTLGKSFGDFESDVLLRSAVERQFQILGEALNRLVQRDVETAALIPDIHRIIGFRNVIVHGYDALDMEIVWTNAIERLPPLITCMSELLPPP